MKLLIVLALVVCFTNAAYEKAPYQKAPSQKYEYNAPGAYQEAPEYAAKQQQQYVATKPEWEQPEQDIGAVFGNSQFALDNLITCPADSLVAARNIECNPEYRYRSVNGVCNNLAYPWWGAVGTPFNRLLQPQYDDVVNAPRQFSSVSKDNLPNARHLSKTLNSTQTESDRSGLLIFFGQFLAHDFAATASDNKITCECGVRDNEECFNIPITTQNPKMPRDCIEFRRDRDVFGSEFECEIRTREQFSDITHWLDASNIYGSDEETAAKLRTFNDGLLKSSVTPGSEFETLPIGDKHLCEKHRAQGCFFAGDARSEENIMLLSVHTHFLRYHNVLARKYKLLNAHLDDETIFQEVRRIVIGVYQNIIYADWLPLVIGQEAVDHHNLSPLRSGYLNEYDNYLFPNAFNEYVASAGRLHPNLPDVLVLGEEDFDGTAKEISTHKLFDLFFAASQSFNDFDRFAYGALITATKQQLDQGFAHSVNDRLFEDVSIPDSTSAVTAARNTSSLGALNIQRGRDHGLQSYNAYRVLAGLPYAEGFEGILDTISHEVVARIELAYKHVDDIDLFYGGMSETQVPGGLVGPTNAYIIARQYHNFKFGDRFYFENGQDKATRFTLPQLNEIRHVSIHSIICESLQTVNVPRNAFRMIGDMNPLMRCSERNDIDLTKF